MTGSHGSSNGNRRKACAALRPVWSAPDALAQTGLPPSATRAHAASPASRRALREATRRLAREGLSEVVMRAAVPLPPGETQIDPTALTRAIVEFAAELLVTYGGLSPEAIADIAWRAALSTRAHERVR